ncbi:hypothetical protein Salat_2515400 [Sesamum alatum]|uniref:Uncharacterized protein n=1 Tax=Sesamum alatum TaxID=300844 RepID=A0AAE2CCA8_9LAMI|nr:hypothetical protein Salat_2515400 [Sesamum alatum]
MDSLMIKGTREWNEDLVRTHFFEEDASCILGISSTANGDYWMVWHFDTKGCFTVRSAYGMALRLLSTASSSSSSLALSEASACSRRGWISQPFAGGVLTTLRPWATSCCDAPFPGRHGR